MDEPYWEHGYRCHGFWLGDYRIGLVYIRQGRGSATKFGYGWECTLGPYVTGNESTLVKAKRRVEKAAAAALATPGVLARFCNNEKAWR